MQDRLKEALATQQGRLVAGAGAFVVLLAVFAVLIGALGGGDGDTPTTSPPTSQGDGPPDPDGPDEPGPLDSADEIQAAVERAEPGDDLVIASGTYRLSLDINGVSGTADQPIRFRAEPGGEVTIINADEGRYALFLRNADHWEIGSTDGRLIFDGDDVAHATVGLGLYSGSIAETSNEDPGPTRGIVLRNVDIVGAGQGLLRIGHNSADIEVVDSRLSGSGRRRAEFGEGIYIGSAAGEDVTRDVRITDVAISDVRAEAIDVKPGTDDILVQGVEITDVVLRSDDTYNKCAISQRSQGSLRVLDTTIRDVRAPDDVDITRNEPCGIYVDGPISIEGASIERTQREAVWVNNTAPDIDVRVVHSEFRDNGGEPSGISHSGHAVEWTVRANELEGLSPSVAGPNVEVTPPPDPSEGTTTTASGTS
jgi:hypothetical protein